MKSKSLSRKRVSFLLIVLSGVAVFGLAAKGSHSQKPETQPQIIDETAFAVHVESQDIVGLTHPQKSTFGSIMYMLSISVRAVRPGSAADTAGIKPGDIIARIGGVSLRGVQTLRAIETCAPGTLIDVEYLRPNPDSHGFTRVNVQVPLDAPRRQVSNLAANVDAPSLPFDSAYQDQVLLKRQPPRSSFGIIGDVLIRVTYVEARSPAERAGLKPGDFITQIGGMPIRGVQTLKAVQAEPPGTLIDVVYLRSQPDGGASERVSAQVALAPLK